MKSSQKNICKTCETETKAFKRNPPDSKKRTKDVKARSLVKVKVKESEDKN